MTNSYSPLHSHEPAIPPTLDAEGRCLVCALLVERDEMAARLRAAGALTLEHLNALAQEFLSRPDTLADAFKRSPAQYVREFAGWLLPRLGGLARR